jgi:DNA-binding NtrC family response regulator
MSPPTQKKRRPGRETPPLIFLVDDQSMLLDLAEMSLQGDGYTLKKFTDPELALKAFRNARVKPAMLITDYAMGKMNGLELIEKCKEINPGLKSMLISGTAGAEIVLDSPTKVDRFVGKPYHPANLAEMVRRILRRDEASA